MHVENSYQTAVRTFSPPRGERVAGVSDGRFVAKMVETRTVDYFVVFDLERIDPKYRRMFFSEPPG